MAPSDCTQSTKLHIARTDVCMVCCWGLESISLVCVCVHLKMRNYISSRQENRKWLKFNPLSSQSVSVSQKRMISVLFCYLLNDKVCTSQLMIQCCWRPTISMTGWRFYFSISPVWVLSVALCFSIHTVCCVVIYSVYVGYKLLNIRPLLCRIHTHKHASSVANE